MSITEKRLKEIQERLDAAMKGPWSIDSDDSTYVIHPEKGGWDGLVIAQVADHDGALFSVEHNGALIAHAPQDLTDLLAEIHRLRAELAKTREVTEGMVERAAEAWYVAQNPGMEDWALSAWADMGGSEPSEERSATTLAAHAALTAVLGSEQEGTR